MNNLCQTRGHMIKSIQKGHTFSPLCVQYMDSTKCMKVFFEPIIINPINKDKSLLFGENRKIHLGGSTSKTRKSSDLRYSMNVGSTILTDINLNAGTIANTYYVYQAGVYDPTLGLLNNSISFGSKIYTGASETNPNIIPYVSYTVYSLGNNMNNNSVLTYYYAPTNNNLSSVSNSYGSKYSVIPIDGSVYIIDKLIYELDWTVIEFY